MHPRDYSKLSPSGRLSPEASPLVVQGRLQHGSVTSVKLPWAAPAVLFTGEASRAAEVIRSDGQPTGQATRATFGGKLGSLVNMVLNS